MLTPNSLSKLGYRVGLTSTEYTLNTLESLLKLNGREEFIKGFIKVAERVLDERSTNAGAINVLKLIGDYVSRNKDFDVDEIRVYINELVNKVNQACSEAALIASHRVSAGDVLMTLSRSLCLERMFKTLVKSGVDFKVYVLESRPGLEGLNTAKLLDQLGVENYVVVDSAARFYIKNVDKVFVGCETVAVNGAVVGKVGTSLLSLISNEARVRVFVLAPLYKFSFETVFGELIKIPEGDWSYLMDDETRKTLPDGYGARVPLFDVTPPKYIDALVTEFGLFSPYIIHFVAKSSDWFRASSIEFEDLLRKVKELM